MSPTWERNKITNVFLKTLNINIFLLLKIIMRTIFMHIILHSYLIHFGRANTLMYQKYILKYINIVLYCIYFLIVTWQFIITYKMNLTFYLITVIYFTYGFVTWQFSQTTVSIFKVKRPNVTVLIRIFVFWLLTFYTIFVTFNINCITLTC